MDLLILRMFEIHYEITMEIRRRSVERYILYYYFFNQLTTKKNLLHQVIDNVHPEKILNNTPTNFESKEEEKKNRPRRETRKQKYPRETRITPIPPFSSIKQTTPSPLRFLRNPVTRDQDR